MLHTVVTLKLGKEKNYIRFSFLSSISWSRPARSSSRYLDVGHEPLVALQICISISVSRSRASASLDLERQPR